MNITTIKIAMLTMATITVVLLAITHDSDYFLASQMWCVGLLITDALHNKNKV